MSAQPKAKTSENCQEASTALEQKNIFIGRQAIFDRNMGVMAYELLYRSGETNSAGVFDGDAATSQVVINAFMEMGLSSLVGGQLAFINLTRNFLTGLLPVPFPKDQVVLEVLEDIEVDEALIAGVRLLKQQGFKIALDDCVYTESLDALLPLTDIVKIDVQAMDRDTLEGYVEKFREYPVQLVAEKVEDQDDFDFCFDLGFDYFQGYFLCRPRVISGNRIPDSKLQVMRLLAAMQDPTVPASELEDLVSQDVSLSYKLLRYINSAFYALPRKIESIGQALVYLGNRTIKTWATLMVFSGIEGKPPALVNTALCRAKMCELLAMKRGKQDYEIFFTVGMFSALDAMMDLPMKRVLKKLPLTEDVCTALLDHAGPYGSALACTLAYEQGDWEHVALREFDAGQIREIYLEAIAWADEISGSLAGL